MYDYSFSAEWAAAAGTILLIVGFLFALLWWLAGRTLRKAGFSAWWALLGLVPVVNVVMLWVFAFAEWPALKNNPPS